MEPYFLWEKKGKRYFQLPPGWHVLRNLAIRCEEPTQSLDEMLEGSLTHPMGTPPLREMVKAGDRVLFLVDDLTRPTPKKQILTFLVHHLETAGIRPEQMRVLFALGTHRPLSESEVEEALGKEFMGKIPFSQHDSRSENLVPIGRLRTGAEVRIHPFVLEADFRIGIGSIVPHPFAGFGGGPKIIMPGVANYDAIREHHMTYLIDPESRSGRLDDNPCFEEILQVARKANLNFLVNTVYNGREEIKAVVSGDFEKAHRHGAALTLREIEVRIDQEADVTITSAFPYDEGPQIIKPLGPAVAMTRKGGTVILLASLRSGKLPELFLKAFDRVFELSKGDPGSLVCRHVEERRALVPEVSMDFNCALGHTLLYLTRVRVILVSRDIRREEAFRLGFGHAASLEEAMERVSRDQPRAQVNIVPAAGLIIPIS